MNSMLQNGPVKASIINHERQTCLMGSSAATTAAAATAPFRPLRVRPGDTVSDGGVSDVVIPVSRPTAHSAIHNHCDMSYVTFVDQASVLLSSTRRSHAIPVPMDEK